MRFSAERNALAREALARIGDCDPDRAVRIRAVIEMTRNPWLPAAEPQAGVSAQEAERRIVALHAEYAARLHPRYLEQRRQIAREIESLAVGTGRHADAAWAIVYQLEIAAQSGLRTEFDAGMIEFTAVIEQLDSPIWKWRHLAAQRQIASIEAHPADAADLAEQARFAGIAAGSEDAALADLVFRWELARWTGEDLEGVERDVRRWVSQAPTEAHSWHALVLLKLGRTEEAIAIWRSVALLLPEVPQEAREWLLTMISSVDLAIAARDQASAQFLREALAPWSDQHFMGSLFTEYGGPIAGKLAELELFLGNRKRARDLATLAASASESFRAPRFAAKYSQLAASLAPSNATLSTREEEVARLVSEGMSNREIAERLYISGRTVESHVASIFRKLGVSSRSSVARHILYPPS
ncbi:MAG: hypothetical protein IT192_07310 [Microbacteriaceae bacterium]|nr:hypothetical protein [Microbacteriaceae bacterium]